MEKASPASDTPTTKGAKVGEQTTQPIQKKTFSINFGRAVTEFDRVMQRLKVKKVLYRTILRGKGLEFDSYRQFGFGDDASYIDWNASLRANDLLSRVYVEERDLNVYFLVDVGGSMLFGSGEQLKAEFIAEFVAALSHLVLNVGDRIGLVLFNDTLVKILPPANKKTQFGLFMKFLSDPKLYGGGSNLNRAIEYALQTTKSPYTIFFILSDFITLGKEQQRNLKLLGSKFETIAISIRDPFDEKMPVTGYQFALQDPATKKQIVLDPDVAARRYRENVLKQKALIKEIMRDAKIDMLQLTTDKRFTIPTAIFLKGRAGRKR